MRDEYEFLDILVFLLKHNKNRTKKPTNEATILSPEENAEVTKGIENGTIKQIRR